MRRTIVVLLGLMMAGCDSGPTWNGKTARAWKRQLSAPAVTMRIEAATALGHFEPPHYDAIPDLIKCLHDPDKDLRREAARTLGLMGVNEPGVLCELNKLEKDKNEDPEVRKAASDALGDIAQRPIR